MTSRTLKISATELTELTMMNDFTVVHIDAVWDGCRFGLAENIQALREQDQAGVAYAYMDCDEEQDYAREIGLLNVPSVAYYRGAFLVAVVAGMRQDVAENLKITIAGGTPDSSSRISGL